jgi:uncharacterized protein YaiI (UPF0178 family)
VTIWADGDSLQGEVRDLLCRRARKESATESPASGRPRFTLVFVAARAPRVELGPGIELILVEGGPGAADDRMSELATSGDLAVTRDLPLAARLAEKGLRVLNDRGIVFTADTARERRSLRDGAAELRSLGLAPESPRARSWGKKELKAFADALDRELARSFKS